MIARMTEAGERLGVTQIDNVPGLRQSTGEAAVSVDKARHLKCQVHGVRVV